MQEGKDIILVVDYHAENRDCSTVTGHKRRNPRGDNELRRAGSAKTRQLGKGLDRKALQSWPCCASALFQQPLPIGSCR